MENKFKKIFDLTFSWVRATQEKKRGFDFKKCQILHFLYMQNSL